MEESITFEIFVPLGEVLKMAERESTMLSFCDKAVLFAKSVKDLLSSTETMLSMIFEDISLVMLLMNWVVIEARFTTLVVWFKSNSILTSWDDVMLDMSKSNEDEAWLFELVATERAAETIFDCITWTLFLYV